MATAAADDAVRRPATRRAIVGDLLRGCLDFAFAFAFATGLRLRQCQLLLDSLRQCQLLLDSRSECQLLLGMLGELSRKDPISEQASAVILGANQRGTHRFLTHFAAQIAHEKRRL